MKLLLYCCKNPHKLYATNEGYVITDFELGDYYKNKEKLNGKIVAECDFEVEKLQIVYGKGWETKTIKGTENIEKLTCLNRDKLYQYCKGNGYAIHIKNLHIFDKPKELNEVYKIENVGGMLFTKPLTQAPQNMMRVSVNPWDYATYEPNDINVLISIQPQWMCLILNHIKDVEVRRVVLKEMLK